MSHGTLKTTCGEAANSKVIDASYLVVDIMSPYNIILGCFAIDPLGAVLSAQYLTLKYLFPERRVRTIWKDQQVTRECYLSILETVREELALVDVHPSEVPNTDFEGWDPILGVEAKKITRVEDLKEV